jgi:hypothetical protein
MNMEKNERIFIKLELEKSQTSNDVLLTMTFDKNAPNFFTENNMIRWRPTTKEIDFFNEAFSMFVQHRKFTQPHENDETTLATSEHDAGDTVLIEHDDDVIEKVIKRKKL